MVPNCQFSVHNSLTPTYYNMARTKLTARATTRQFYVRTTTDEDRSNCVYTQTLNRHAIEATKDIKAGKLIIIYTKNYSSDDEDTMTQSTVDKHKHELNNNAIDLYDSSNEVEDTMTHNTNAGYTVPCEDHGYKDPILEFEKQCLEVKIAMAKKEIWLWEQSLKELYDTMNNSSKNEGGIKDNVSNNEHLNKKKKSTRNNIAKESLK